MLIGEVAKRSGIGVETVRYYEREGLIPTPDRSPSGYRRFPEAVVTQVQFIQYAKKLGFSLKEIGELLSLKNQGTSTCENVRVAAVIKLEDIQRKINALEEMKMMLAPLVEKCRSVDPIGNCPILNVSDEK